MLIRLINRWRLFIGRRQYRMAYFSRNLPAAIEIGREILRFAPNDPGAHDALGVALLEANQAEEAVKSLQRAVELYEHPIHLNNLGRALLQAKRYDEARRAFERAIQLDPVDPLPRYNLTVILGDEGRLDEMAAALNRFVGMFPKHEGSQNNLGVYWERKGDREKALTYFDGCVTNFPNSVLARMNLIRVLCDLGRYPDAHPHLQALTTFGISVLVDADQNQFMIDLNGEPFYRGEIKQ
jgi:Flp pilus assembly protein TadD